MNCFHCDRKVNEEAGLIEIVKRSAEGKPLGLLRFHVDCFVEVAGTEYDEALNIDNLYEAIGLTLAESRMVQTGQYIAAIKEVRARLDLTLKRAKNLVDRYKKALG